MEKYLVIINTVIAVALSYIALGEQIAKLSRWIRNKATHYYDAKDIVKLILQWFDIIDNNDVELEKKQIKKLDKVENEISFLFHRDGIDKKMILKSSKFFRNKYLEYVGLKKKFRTIDQYKKYAHIKDINLGVSLALLSAAHHKRYSALYFPLSFYWMIIQGNYLQWKRQYIKNWEGINETDKVIYSDIEMPIKLLRMYYKI